MAFNGSGVFNRLYSWVTDAANGLFISSTRMDAEMDGMATGLSNCITKDGQTTVTANIPMGGFKFTGIANGSAATDSVAYGQLSTFAPASSYYDAGNSGASITIDFAVNGPNQKVTLTNNCTITVNNATNTNRCRLLVIQDATGNRAITWAGANYSASRWIGAAAAPVLNPTASSSEFVDFIWSGSVWYQQHIGPVARRPVYTILATKSGTQNVAIATTAAITGLVATVDPYSEVSAGGITLAQAGLYLIQATMRFNPNAGAGQQRVALDLLVGTSVRYSIGSYPTDFGTDQVTLTASYVLAIATNNAGISMNAVNGPTSTSTITIQATDTSLQVTRLGDGV